MNSLHDSIFILQQQLSQSIFTFSKHLDLTENIIYPLKNKIRTICSKNLIEITESNKHLREGIGCIDECGQFVS